MAKLRFFHGVMGSGKTEYAITEVNTWRQAGYHVAALTGTSRTGQMGSRSGRSIPAVTVLSDTNIAAVVDRKLIQHVVVDEAQFLSEVQVDDLSWLVDKHGLSVSCYGLLTDFRMELFAGSKRLVEMADSVDKIGWVTRCWCGEQGRVNARVVNGQITLAGPTVQVGDVGSEYELLCRRHWRMGKTAAVVA